MNITPNKVETTIQAQQTGFILHGATIRKQLNGTSLYVVFEGTEQAIYDAFNTLYNANAFDATEPDFLNDYQACITTSPSKFKRGLFNREIFHLMDAPAQASNKGRKHGFAAQAWNTALAIWDSIQSATYTDELGHTVRTFNPTSTVIMPEAYRATSMHQAPEWMTERPDANAD